MTSRSATPLASNETLFRFRVISEVLHQDSAEAELVETPRGLPGGEREASE